MVFSDATTLDGLIQEVDRICGSSDNTYSLKAKTARLNSALDRFIGLALEFGGDWQFDDSNYTDLPIGTTNLVSGQYDYSFASELLTVNKVLCKDNNGNWVELQLIDQEERAARNLLLQPTGNVGAPIRYDVFASSVLLDPVPNYNSTGGLKIWFQRNASKFVSTDTTKVPGVPNLFHPYLARYAALPFCIEKRLAQKNDVAAQILVDEKAIEEFMSDRNKSKPTMIIPVTRSSR